MRSGKTSASTMPSISWYATMQLKDTLVASNSVSAVVRGPGGGWKAMRVHPTALKLIGYQGEAKPQDYDGKMNQMIGSARDSDDPMYDNIDRYCYNPQGIVGEEEPTTEIEDTVTTRHDEEAEAVLAKGSGIIVKGNESTNPMQRRFLKRTKKNSM